MPRRAPLVGLALALTLALGACSSNKATRLDEVGRPQAQALDKNSGGLADMKTENEAPAAPPAPGRARAVGGANAPAQPPAEGSDAERAAKPKPANEPAATSGLYIIRKANLSLQVPSVKDAQTRITGLVAGHHGMVTDSHFDTAEGGVPTATLTVRVPADQFDALLNQLGDVGTVRTRQVSGEDVTLEYVDTGSRIRNLQREETQLLQLLQRTGKLADVLEVERELARVRGEIEQAQGRLRHLASQVDLATIEITLSEKIEVVSTSPWQIDVAFKNAWSNAERQLASTLAWIVSVTVDFVVATLPILLLALIAFLIVGWILRKVVVDALKLLGSRMFNGLWAAIGFVLLAINFPPLFGVVLLALLVVAIAWAGRAVFGRMFRRRGDLDA